MKRGSPWNLLSRRSISPAAFLIESIIPSAAFEVGLLSSLELATQKAKTRIYFYLSFIVAGVLSNSVTVVAQE